MGISRAPQCCLYPLAQSHTAGWWALNGELLPCGLLTPTTPMADGHASFLSKWGTAVSVAELPGVRPHRELLAQEQFLLWDGFPSL